jgi:hypothetical protein
LGAENCPRSQRNGTGGQRREPDELTAAVFGIHEGGVIFGVSNSASRHGKEIVVICVVAPTAGNLDLLGQVFKSLVALVVS